MKKLIIALPLILFGVYGIYTCTIWWLFETNQNFQTRFNLPPHQLWSHNGDSSKGASARSFEAIKTACEIKGAGLEFNIDFDPERKLFVLHSSKSSQAKPLSLVFETCGKRFYWLDYKTINQGNPKELALALKQLLITHGLEKMAFVEAWRREELAVYAQTGLMTSYWKTLKASPGSPEFYSQLFTLRANVVKLGFDVISGEASAWNDKAIQAVHPFPLLLFTVNDPLELARLQQHDNVYIILTDRHEWIQNQAVPR